MSTRPTVVGLGEILWDMLPSGRQLGGAPANFAYCSHVLGGNAFVLSRVGDDQPGKDVRAMLGRSGISDEFLQSDLSHPTGTVQVQIDPAGQPRFEITQPVAWDFLEWTPAWYALAKSASAVCFGSLAQRSPNSRLTIRQFLDATRTDSLRIFDVNLRQQFYSAEIILESLQRANAVKLNHEEVTTIRELLAVGDGDEVSFCRSLITKFELKLVCVTRGNGGSLLCDKRTFHEHSGFRVKVRDTIGAGDAFTAGLVHEFLSGKSLQEMNETGNRMGAWVASQSGGMPPFPETGIEKELAKLG